MIIGVRGEAGSGKDTVATYLIKQHGFERRAFADPLKKSVAALFDIPFHEVDKLKLDHTVSVQLVKESKSFPGSREMQEVIEQMTFRAFLQRYGTEAHRDIPEMGDDFWVDLSIPNNGYYMGRKIVVSDVRFENEARRIRYHGGVVVHIERPRTELLDPQDQHRSEVFNWDPDYTIFNTGTIEELGERVEMMLDNVIVNRH